jgi:hypothetical protein
MDGPSTRRLRELLTRDDGALRMLLTEALFHHQVAWTCQLLDVVDAVADPVTATVITDALAERLAGDGVTEAAERIRDAQDQIASLARGWSGWSGFPVAG